MSLTSKKGYIVRSNINPKLIYCTDKDFHHEDQVGPGGWCAKVYKTKGGVDRTFPDRSVLIEALP